ncbi:hypothetical protein MCOR27_003983 [Pyricularia oryzae]|uniref:Zinc/iron permease n=2 Tax=Pyricularia TaxID=48558 RepID=A0ABQ8NSI0_PYRGI|nr:hypothetical protein MCOR02_001202 [Pyricularia oryzae]KAI6301460.1 hypothetical protein MCOR33_002985 [Pyricularia grisea]KAI6281884.1 hypothetical protein MCOR27_003983 [Pyricularia oryzae]KAI6284509.1 hypothetical protein MCOR26_001929 [Pyricularia oryzae]KAI6315764.1 hypothetical protein MCOR29_006860 [Pyricularia oryzae]
MSSFVPQDFSWTSIPTELLAAELARRDDVDTKPKCGSKERGHYDTALHVFALGLILLLSTCACAFPLLTNRSGGGRRQTKIVFICQHFGTGVLIATAFVHLLPTAFLSLTDPCLPHVFSKGYTAMAGLVAMTAALVVVSVESYLTTRGGLTHSHSHHHVWDEDDEEGEDGNKTQGINGASSSGGMAARRERRPSNIMLDDIGASEGLMAGASPLPESTPVVASTNGRKHLNGNANDPQERNKHVYQPRDSSSSSRESLDLELNLDELDPVPEHDAQPRAPPSQQRDRMLGQTPAPPPDEQKRLLLQCLLLEAGILFHSVFIGMALSVATGPAFVVFLVAISFHQSFEGLALGSRIAAIHFPRSSLRPWLMVLAYGTTTPIGQAIGLLVHNMYDPRSQAGLLMVGFMNAISAGLLLFAGLVQLLAEDFLSEKSYRVLHGRRRTEAFLAVFGGAGLMAVVGAFA